VIDRYIFINVLNLNVTSCVSKYIKQGYGKEKKGVMTDGWINGFRRKHT